MYVSYILTRKDTVMHSYLISAKYSYLQYQFNAQYSYLVSQFK
uniref:Uncharacterized protein n=1 Tax=Anguilla anguilla TaxID=7936 RepID=A0A0E9U5D0_ANGAN